MKKILICLALTFFGALSAFSQTVRFFSVSSPNSLSSSWGTWRANGQNALKTDQLTAGTLGTPGFFDASDSIMMASEIITTSDYFSWHGQLNPGSVFGSGFANEKGNMYALAFVIQKTDSQFSLSQVTGTRSLSGSITLSEPVPGLSVYSFVGPIGVLYGVDQSFGGGDDTYLVSGTSAQLVDALIYGPISWNVVSGSGAGASDQERLNNAIGIAEYLTATTTIFLNGTEIASFAQTFEPVIVPEPMTYVIIFGVIALVLAFLRRYHLQRAIA